jgi:non-ribosomal peptide synthetase component F
MNTVEPARTFVVDDVDRAVREFPDSPALRSAGGIISYRQFGNLVDGVAVRLDADTAPGEFVGIEAGRGPGAVVAMVAAMRTGRPFVFVDRRDSASSNTSKVGLLGVRVLARPSGPDPVAGDVGYAVFTSGSTGEPKCVLVRAAPLAPVIRDHVERLAVGPGCTTLQFARLTFDGCITEILWTLSAGACLVVVDESRLAPGPVLQDTLERFGVTHLKTTPFALTATDPTGAMRLRHVINGGGPCRFSVLRKWSAVASFHNAYGLTETTVCNLLTGPLRPDDCRESVPLGEVVGDCSYHLREVGDGTGPAAAGAPVRRGELVITGDSVAIGYLTRDGLRPFSRAGGSSAYRTGDLVELRDGQLHFVERLDRQLKVRGYRLDPGEIESAACRLHEVRDAVVVAEGHDGADTAEQDALVCYYRGDLDPRSLRRHLEGILDPYKIPSVLERVDTLPYTANGKLDTRALQSGRRARGVPARPATPGQQVLHLARTLTGTSDVELDDNFFDVGGDSASAIVLVNKMRELGWLDAGVRDVLRAENLRVLADRLHELTA